MPSLTASLLQKLLVKYAGVPNQEAVLLANELDELRKYDTEAALLADVANVTPGTMAYAIDTGAAFLRGISAFTLAASPLADGEAFLQQKVTLSNSEIKNLTTAPKTLVPAVANKMIALHDVVMKLNAGTEVLTETIDNMIINYVDAAGVAATGAIEATGFIDQAADTLKLVKGVGIPAGTIAQLVNTPLILDNTGDGDYAGNASNDATMDVWCRYSLITV